MLPRYVVPRASDPEPAPALRGPLLTHVRDLFRLVSRGRSPREVAVVEDRQGALHLVDDLSALPAPQRGQLHHHELLLRRPPRTVRAEALWLFALQLLEQPADAPGLNDPLWLYGRMVGPFPASGDGAVALDAQLTVTRADLLAGFVRGAADAFHVHATPATRCLHALLPADREAEIAAGEGLVLLYPVIPVELAPTDAGNEGLVSQLLHDVMTATQQDAARNGVPHPLVGRTIPVPSREDLERELDAKGYDIVGDKAVRRTDATKRGSLGGFLSQVFGVPDHLTLSLPPEGRIDAFLALAKEAVAGFPGYPDATAAALAGRTGDGPAAPPAPRAPHVPRPSGEPPRPSRATTIPPVSAPRSPRSEARTVPPERASAKPAAASWMADFVQQHPRPPDRPARVTPSAPRKAPPGKAAPDWMKDFED